MFQLRRICAVVLIFYYISFWSIRLTKQAIYMGRLTLTCNIIICCFRLTSHFFCSAPDSGKSSERFHGPRLSVPDVQEIRNNLCLLQTVG